jgi:hypothetical protein
LGPDIASGTGIDARQAGQIVTRVVNDLAHLQEQAPWFAAGPGLRGGGDR